MQHGVTLLMSEARMRQRSAMAQGIGHSLDLFEFVGGRRKLGEGFVDRCRFFGREFAERVSGEMGIVLGVHE